MVILFVLYCVITFFFLIYEYKTSYITPSFIAIGMQFIMFIGIYFLYDKDNTADIELIVIYFVALIFYLMGDRLIKFYKKSRIILPQNADEIVLSNSQFNRAVCLALFSIVVCAWFFEKVGFNVFLMMIESYISGDIVNLSYARKQVNMTAGNGWIYQFRIYILPMITMYLVLFEKGMRRIFGICLIPFTVIYMFGSGQRGGAATVILILVVAIMLSQKYLRGRIKIRKKQVYIILISFCFVFAALTIFNGRVDESGSVLNAVIKRIFKDNQNCALFAFRNIKEMDCQYGMDWLKMFLKLLPGNYSYTPLSSQLHQAIYGSLTGTSPPCKWGSVYYNFYILGIPIIALLNGICGRWIYTLMLKKPFTPYHMLIYAGISVVFGIWVADAPTTLLNEGLIAILFLNIVLRKPPLLKKQQRD
jgi:oligosaccharide repeat unit polymerase